MKIEVDYAIFGGKFEIPQLLVGRIYGVFIAFLKLNHFLQFFVLRALGAFDLRFVCCQSLFYELEAFLYDFVYPATVVRSFEKYKGLRLLKAS